MFALVTNDGEPTIHSFKTGTIRNTMESKGIMPASDNIQASWADKYGK